MKTRVVDASQIANHPDKSLAAKDYINTNCLEGMLCPECGANEPFLIVAQAVFKVFDEGTDGCTDVVWNDDDRCRCVACEHIGTVKNFSKEE